MWSVIPCAPQSRGNGVQCLILRPARSDLRPEQTDYRPKRPKMRPNMPNINLERPDFRPFKP